MHRATKQGRIAADLIIVDEAHRSRADQSDFRVAIGNAVKRGCKVLFLTATPMSINIKEMASMLNLLGCSETATAVKAFSDEINLLYSEDRRSDADASSALSLAAKAAANKMRGYVIRHTIDGLDSDERHVFGRPRQECTVSVPRATPAELELLARMDRLQRLAHPRSRHTNDPRFHVARMPLRVKFNEACQALKQTSLADVAAPHIQAIEQLGLLDKPHPKMVAVTKFIAERLEEQEKVVVFCHHHMVKEELTRYMASKLTIPAPTSRISRKAWHDGWAELIDNTALDTASSRYAGRIRNAFLSWICGAPFKRQILGWLPKPGGTVTMARILATQARHSNDTIGAAMAKLYQQVASSHSKSTYAIFRQLASKPELIDSMPFGSQHAGRVLGASKPTEKSDAQEPHLFLHEQRPDLLLALFNSPFGPDVLVLTDSYSEGIDLHRACRFLVHYELDPSPMRTIQREGRIRRVGNRASVVDKPVEYAMPAFAGTRDERLVAIMRERINAFGLLLGGVPSLREEDAGSLVDQRAMRILSSCRSQLEPLSKLLTAR